MTRAVLDGHLLRDLLTGDVAAELESVLAEHLDAPWCVWSGDDGPAIRGATEALGRDHRTVRR